VRLLPPTDINMVKAKDYWWRLIWCHERCHKGSENRLRCRSIRNAIADTGGKLVALRKAAQFIQWAEQHQVLPYVVVTDWREAQPLIKSLMAAPPELVRPSLTVILCESARQHRRAHAWSQNLPPNLGKVIACRPPFVPIELLDGVLAEYFNFGCVAALGDKDADNSPHQNSMPAKTGMKSMEVSHGQSEAPTREPSDVENDHKEHESPKHELELAQLIFDSQERLPPPIPNSMLVHRGQENHVFPDIPEPIHLARAQDGRLVIRTCQGQRCDFAPGNWNMPASR